MTSREWLEHVRECAAHIEPLHRELSALEDARRDCLPWQCKGSALYASMGGTHSDPTASEAQARIDGLDEQIVRVRAEYDECVGVVGECLRMLETMRQELGECHAKTIEYYYINCADTWSEVAWEMGRHRDTVRAWREEAFAWIAAHSARYGMIW